MCWGRYDTRIPIRMRLLALLSVLPSPMDGESYTTHIDRAKLKLMPWGRTSSRHCGDTESMLRDQTRFCGGWLYTDFKLNECRTQAVVEIRGARADKH
jgi:hypothetical protein